MLVRPDTRRFSELINRYLEGLFRMFPLEMPIPRSLGRACNCPEECFHSDDCPDTPLWAELFPAGWDWVEPWPRGFRIQYPCAADLDDQHVLGEISGPAHWCDRVGSVVGLESRRCDVGG